MNLALELERAAEQLPEGMYIAVIVERGSAWVELKNREGETIWEQSPGSDHTIAELIRMAVRVALAKGE